MGLDQTFLRSFGINNPAKSPKCSKGQFMISVPPSRTLYLQAKHSVWGEGRDGEKEEEININTVISSESTTWRRADFTWSLLLGFRASRDHPLEGRAGRDPALFCTPEEKLKE